MASEEKDYEGPCMEAEDEILDVYKLESLLVIDIVQRYNSLKLESNLSYTVNCIARYLQDRDKKWQKR